MKGHHFSSGPLVLVLEPVPIVLSKNEFEIYLYFFYINMMKLQSLMMLSFLVFVAGFSRFRWILARLGRVWVRLGGFWLRLANFWLGLGKFAWMHILVIREVILRIGLLLCTLNSALLFYLCDVLILYPLYPNCTSLTLFSNKFKFIANSSTKTAAKSISYNQIMRYNWKNSALGTIT